MADFTTNLSGVAQLDAHLISLYLNQFYISAAEGAIKGLDDLVTIQEEINGKLASFPIYTKLAKQTSALNSREDVVSEAMVDAPVTITPAEFGNVMTPTNLAILQSGGVPAVAAVELAGINARESKEALMLLVGEAGTNELFVGQTSEAAITASDIMSRTYVNRAYNKLNRVGIPKISGTNHYVAIAHDDVIHDIREENSAGDWVDVVRYAAPGEALANEVGMFGGFRWISHPSVTVNADAGASAVDTYHTQFMGANAIGKGVSQRTDLVVSGPFDKLQRMINIGWYGVYNYALVDTAAHWVVTSASSIGTNT